MFEGTYREADYLRVGILCCYCDQRRTREEMASARQCRSCVAARKARWYQEHRDECNARDRRWRKANRGNVTARQRARRARRRADGIHG